VLIECRSTYAFGFAKIRYDTIGDANVRSKADMSQLNLPHTKTEKLKSKNGYAEK